jgi:hypothetical protein
VFLTEALRYMGGAVERVMIDNTHVVVLPMRFPVGIHFEC